jgi:hypothetical protein
MSSKHEERSAHHECALDANDGEFFWTISITECDECGCSECARVASGVECSECGKFYRIR